ncbi:M20 family metallopeptidase [Wukongibacter baidiensis]|uniref:M20 metallopeptidase family protein n=1 Tax=Wukongibacter baidiensis TaxID=1723361 RepID=UPI003D7F2467
MIDIFNEIRQINKKIISWRRELHKIPEIGLNLPNTMAYICSKLDSMGVEYRVHKKTSGIEGVLMGSEPGKTIALRADMDAIPIEEKTGLPYASNNGNMHACGHDCHMAMLLGAIKVLNLNRDKIKGNIKFIFQPGEEGYCGAKEMINEGVLENPKVHAMIGLHVTNALNGVSNGKIGIGYGPLMASSDTFKVKIIGKGSHGARPEMGVDPVVISAQVITALQSIVSREIGVSQNLVITVGKIHGGTVPNTIPDYVEFEGTVRTLDEELRRNVAKRIEQIVSNVTKSMLGNYELSYNFRYPPVVNNIQLTKEIKESIEKVVGKDGVVEIESPIMAGEDIAYFFQEVPGTYLHLGSVIENQEEKITMHNPKFQVNEDVLWIGSAVLAQSGIDWLSRNM